MISRFQLHELILHGHSKVVYCRPAKAVSGAVEPQTDHVVGVLQAVRVLANWLVSLVDCPVSS